jgi:WhiB family redox-sensing transcriptional regulator
VTQSREPRATPTGFVPYGVVDFAVVDLSWHVDALCAETDPEVFFPEKGGSTRAAKAVCAECPVAAECLNFAIDTGQKFGIWGGVPERKRRKLMGLPEDDDVEGVAA